MRTGGTSRLLAAVTAASMATAAAAAAAPAPDFYTYWGDGRAEVSSYRIVQPRYGEARTGYGVFIFVTEDLNRNTLIKVESPTPKADRIYTLKLNNVLKFTTGIYDYSVMTSVFSAVEPVTETRPFELLKLSLSSQEWCGNVYEEMQVLDGQLQGELFSYFEREGRQSWRFDKPKRFASEDHLLIRIRELKEPSMAEGETRTVTLLPSLWQFRIKHRARELVPAQLRKGLAAKVTVGGKAYTAVPWNWSYPLSHGGQRDKTVWVDTAYPHRILKWEDNAGGSGALLVSRRLPYWGQHGVDDGYLRDELNIPK